MSERGKMSRKRGAEAKESRKRGAEAGGGSGEEGRREANPGRIRR